MFRAFEGVPVNLGILGRAASYTGSSARAPDRVGRLRAQGPRGLRGYPRHRRRGAHRGRRPRHPDRDAHRRPERVVRARERPSRPSAGRSIHAYHVEGIGGGHSPDILAIAGVGHVIGLVHDPDDSLRRGTSSAEHHAMMWSVHG